MAEESEYADNLFSLMLLQACSHKHIGFNSENEVRLVTPYPDSVNSEYEEIRYVTNAERIRKVLVLRLENFCKFKDVPYDNLLQKLISSIIIGPRWCFDRQLTKTPLFQTYQKNPTPAEVRF